MFWLVCAMMTLAVMAMVLAPMLRPPVETGDDPQVTLYKAQLAELESDVARDVIAAEDAERAKTEIARRLLAASQVISYRVDSDLTRPTALIMAFGVAGLAGATYWSLGAPGYPDLPLQTRIALAEEARATRPSQAAAEAAARELTPPEVPADYLSSVEQLRALMPSRGGDLQGWELLSYHEAQLRNFPDAAKAQARVIEIKGSEATPDDLIRYADLLVAAADGFISPETETVVRQVLTMAPNSVAARYYLGALYDQTDRPDLAFRLWRPILESGAPESLYVSLARRQVTDAAFRAGVTYAPPAPELAGPSVDQMMAAQDMDTAAREEMIAGMVGGLADRLATQGGTAAEWARLIIAYSVLGRTEDAKEILAEARSVFGASQSAMAQLNDAAFRAGLAEEGAMQ